MSLVAKLNLPATKLDEMYTLYWPQGSEYQIRTFYECPVNHDRTLYSSQLLPAEYRYCEDDNVLRLYNRPSLLSLMRFFYDNGSSVMQSVVEGIRYNRFLEETVNAENLKCVQKKITGSSNILLFPRS